MSSDEENTRILRSGRTIQLPAPVRLPHVDSIHSTLVPSHPPTEANSSLMESESSKDINQDIISDTDTTLLLDNINQSTDQVKPSLTVRISRGTLMNSTFKLIPLPHHRQMKRLPLQRI